ncbi:MAG: hypothetical protein ACRDJX_07060 [Solirubrobacteraceae bacterium]
MAVVALSLLATAVVALRMLAVASVALAANAPVVETATANEVTDTTATLEAAIDPEGQATTYAFQYGVSTQYAGESPMESLEPPITYQIVTASVTGLQPGTTYHFRIIATNLGGSCAGEDMTFKTAGVAPPLGATPVVVTGPASAVSAHEALLTGTITPYVSSLRYFFEFGTSLPYEFQTISQPLAAGLPRAVRASVAGLQSAQVFHYRLVAVNEAGELSAGSDQSFATTFAGRLTPSGLDVRFSRSARRRLPDVVAVSGTLVPPPSLPRAAACQGIISVTFKVGKDTISHRLAAITGDCTFSLRVRFSVRSRLPGGRVQAHVLFPGNRLLDPLAAPTHTLEIY